LTEDKSATARSGVDITRQFVEENGSDLPQPSRIEWSDAKELYRTADGIEQASFFVKGYAASSVAFAYGDACLETFAQELGQSYSGVRNQRRVYLRLINLKIDMRISILSCVKAGAISHYHLLTADPLKDDAEYVEILLKAHDNGWGYRKLGEAVAVRRQLKVAEGESPAEIKPNDGFLAGDPAPKPEEPKDPGDMNVGEIFARLPPTEDEEPWPGPPKDSEEEKRFYQINQWLAGLTRLDPKDVASFARDAEAIDRSIRGARGVIDWFEAYAKTLEEMKKTPLRVVE
jgi:hypothetical protein